MIWNLILIALGIYIGMQIRHFWNMYGRHTCLVESPEKLDALVEIFNKYGVPTHNMWRGDDGYREVRLRGGLILFCNSRSHTRIPMPSDAIATLMPSVGIASMTPTKTAAALRKDLRAAGFDVKNIVKTPGTPDDRSKTVVCNAMFGTQITVHRPGLQWPRDIKWYQWPAFYVRYLASRAG